jgi:hypothetical protein
MRETYLPILTGSSELDCPNEFDVIKRNKLVSSLK